MEAPSAVCHGHHVLCHEWRKLGRNGPTKLVGPLAPRVRLGSQIAVGIPAQFSTPLQHGRSAHIPPAQLLQSSTDAKFYRHPARALRYSLVKVNTTQFFGHNVPAFKFVRRARKLVRLARFFKSLEFDSLKRTNSDNWKNS